MYRKSSNGGCLSSVIKGFSGHWREVIKITWASLSISSVSSVACTYMWSNCVGTVSIHMTRKIFLPIRQYLRNHRLSITILGAWYMYKPPYFEHWVHFILLLSIGIKDFHFLPLVKNIKARVTTLSKQTNKQWRNVQIKQTIKNTNTNKQVGS